MDDKVLMKMEDLQNCDRIPRAECKKGGLYFVFSRNLTLAVCSEHNNGFVGIREKFGDYYLFTEYHWETGAPFGTVSPKKLLCMVPDGIEPTENVMVEATEEVLKRWASHSYEVGEQVPIENKALFEWLEKQWVDFEKALQEGPD